NFARGEYRRKQAEQADLQVQPPDLQAAHLFPGRAARAVETGGQGPLGASSPACGGGSGGGNVPAGADLARPEVGGGFPLSALPASRGGSGTAETGGSPS